MHLSLNYNASLILSLSLILISFFTFIYNVPIHPGTSLAACFHTAVLFPPCSPKHTHTHSHFVSLLSYTPYFCLHHELNLARSFFSLNATGKVIRGRRASPSSPLRTSHYLRVIFQMWTLIGLRLRLSQ